MYLDSESLWDELAAARVGAYEHAFLMYQGDEPGVAARLRDVLADIDLLVWGTPGWRYFCGATKLRTGWVIDPEAFGAYDGADHLMLRQ